MVPDAHIEIKKLVRTSDSVGAAAVAVRRLVHAVAEWEPGASLDVTFATHDGRRVLVLAQYGTAQPGWEADVRWAVGGIAVLGAKSEDVPDGDTPDWSSVYELRPTRELRPDITGMAGEVASEAAAAPGGTETVVWEASHRFRTVTPWPTPQGDDLRDTAALLSEHPGLMARFRIAPATELEIDMLGATLDRTWTGSDGDLHGYVGRPVRMRALIASQDGEVPARFRALARRWATHLSIVRVPEAEAREAWDGPADSLAGHTVPEGVARSLLRLPAAGNAAFSGFETELPALSSHPLDPVPPKPERPVRLGTATTVAGRTVEATIDARDLLRHGFIEGGSGAGKSTLISVLVRELTQLGYGVTFLDPHGTTIDAILDELPEAGHESVRVVRHEDADRPVPLDILTGDAEEVERAVEAFSEFIQMMYDPRREGIVGPRWKRWFGLLAKAAHQALGEEASLVAVADIGSDTQRVEKLAKAIMAVDLVTAKSLLDEIVKNRSNEAAEVLAWTVSKLQPMFATRHMRAILGTGRDAVDVGACMDDGTTLLVDLASPMLGTQASRVLGALWILKHQMALGRRRHIDRPHVIVVDEAHLFQFGALPSLLAEARKFGVGVVVATQFLGQLETALAESLEANAGSMFTFRTGLPYALRSSTRLAGWPVDELVRLPDLTAAVSLSRSGTATEPFLLSVDHHGRMERRGERGTPTTDERRDAVVERSSRELWEPFASLHPSTPESLDQRLTEVAQTRSARPRPGSPPPRPSADPAAPSFLDEWLAKRKQAQEAQEAQRREQGEAPDEKDES
ncbi:MAG: ATP-binding protein [Aeromicrobium sp.]|uniref:type IV secretory system conjugative DNA transfer family protein n=1 Tax=Aeromicrobium sp. TaxID=1871063 RepID=UPI0039E23FB8